MNALGMITGDQVKAARMLLGWTLEKLAREAALSRTALELLETGRDRPAAVHLRVLYDVLVSAGIRFPPGQAATLAGQRGEAE